MFESPLKFHWSFIPKGPINNIPALVQTMAWCRPGDKLLYEPMMVSLLTHICVTRLQWVQQTGNQFHWKPMVIIMPTLSSLVTMEVVMMATSGLPLMKKLALWQFSVLSKITIGKEIPTFTKLYSWGFKLLYGPKVLLLDWHKILVSMYWPQNTLK